MKKPGLRVRKIRQAGDSLVVAVERSWLEARGLVEGDEVCLFYLEDEIVIQPLNPLQETERPTARSEEE